MTSTIVGYFDDYQAARSAERELIEAGFRDDVQVVANEEGREARHDESFWERMKAAFGFADERELGRYREATTRGGTLLTVRVDDTQTEQAAQILERHHPIDLDERAQSWGGDTKQTLTGLGQAQRDGVGEARREGWVETQASIPIAEESVQVGKRSVPRGALRVHTWVSERPVEETITLREEQAFVERTPVNRPASAGEAAFQERTIDVREVGEEAVVSKQAQVVEELEVGKEQTTRRETVRDTVRKTEVEVQRDDAARR